MGGGEGGGGVGGEGGGGGGEERAEEGWVGQAEGGLHDVNSVPPRMQRLERHEVHAVAQVSHGQVQRRAAVLAGRAEMRAADPQRSAVCVLRLQRDFQRHKSLQKQSACARPSAAEALLIG